MELEKSGSGELAASTSEWLCIDATSLAVLRSHVGQRVTLGYSTGGSYRVLTAIDERLDPVSRGFPATCYITPYAVESPY